MSDDLVRRGDIWKDLDPRGGATFRVVSVDPPLMNPRRALVESVTGKNRRTILIDRFRRSGAYRSGYTLVCREPGTEQAS